jgi:hypothetical protein
MESSTRTIARLIQQAERFILFHDWDEAAARCYRILALDSDNTHAQDKLKQIYQQPELVEAMHCVMARLFAPHDASPHHQRRKLAFSYRVLSRWRGWQDDVEQTPPVDDLEEVAQMIDHAYLTGEDDDLLTAWELFAQTCAEDADDKEAIQWWMAKQYALHGFFADAAEVLAEMLRRRPADTEVRYVLAEMRWWRDQSDALAWIV